MCPPLNLSTIDESVNRRLAEELNEEMRSSVLPVTTIVGMETVFGFLGNLLIVYVFLFHYHKCNFKYFVLCLSFIDTTSTLTTMPGEMVTQTFWYVYPVPLVCKIKSFFNVFTVCGSAFCLLIISIDRYRKICRPLEWQIKPRMALILCFVQLVFAFILALPVAFLWGTHSYIEEHNGIRIKVTVCEKDAEFECTDYPVIYTITVETITTIAMFIMLVLYVFICRKILKTRTPTAGGSSNSASRCANNVESEATLSGGVTSEDEPAASSNVEPMPDVTTSDTQTDNENGVKNENIGSVSFTPLPPTSNASKGKFLTAMANRISKLRRPGKKHTERVRRKTLIMVILTAVFIFTTILYMTLLNLIAKDVLQSLTSAQKSAYFFFFRLYFINHVINPCLYGLYDPHFRRIVKQSLKSLTGFCTSKYSS